MAKELYYAEIDKKGRCFGLLSTDTPFAAAEFPHMVQIPAYDEAYLKKDYIGGEWVEREEPEPEAQPLTEAEQMQIETYLNTAFIADMMALNM